MQTLQISTDNNRPRNNQTVTTPAEYFRAVGATHFGTSTGGPSLPTLIATLLLAISFNAGHVVRAQDVPVESYTSASTEAFMPTPETGQTGLDAGAQGSVGASDPDISPTGTDRFQGKRFRTTVNVRGGYDDNVYTQSVGEEESTFVGGGINFNYDFGTDRTQLTFGLGADADYYLDVTNDDVFYNLRLDFGVTHRVTPRLTVGASTYTTYQSRPDFSVPLASTRDSGEYFYTGSRLFVTYLWSPKFQTVTGLTINGILYSEDDVSDSLDRFEGTFNQEFRYLWTPTTTAIAEYRLGGFAYVEESDRDSIAHFALLGIDHQLAPRSSVTGRVGAEFRDFDDGENLTRPYGELSVSYRAGENTSLSWFNRLGLEQSEFADVDERYTYRTGLSASQQWTPKFSTSLSVFYTHDEYGDQDNAEGFTEDSVDLSLGLNYAFTRLLSASLSYRFSEVFSDSEFREYSRNTISLGLVASF